jgi:hypothetical protein
MATSGNEIRAEHDANRTGERDDAGPDERQYDQAHDGARLQGGGRDHSRKHTLDRARGIFAQEFLEGAAGQELQRFLQLMHAKQEKPKTGGQAPDVDFSVQSSISVCGGILPEFSRARPWHSSTCLPAGRFLRHSVSDSLGRRKWLMASLFG